MKIKIQSAELNRMMKTISQCIDPRFSGRGNIEFIYDNNMLSIRGTNGQVTAVVSTPVLGGDGEIFCIDGAMFAKVCALCNGEIEISTDGKNCIVKGAGRTRLPIILRRPDAVLQERSVRGIGRPEPGSTYRYPDGGRGVRAENDSIGRLPDEH